MSVSHLGKPDASAFLDVVGEYHIGLYGVVEIVRARLRPGLRGDDPAVLAALSAWGGEVHVHQHQEGAEVVLVRPSGPPNDRWGLHIGLFLLTLAQTHAEAGLWPLLTDRIASVVFFIVLMVATRGSPRLPGNVMALALGGGALDMTANALYLLAVRIGPFSPVVILCSLYPASTVLLARAVLGERLSVWQTAGVACALVAVGLIVGT